MVKLKKNRDRGSFDTYYKNVYAPQLLKNLYNSVDSAETRETRIEIDPIAHSLTLRVADLVTKNPPIFLDKQGNELEDIREGWVKGDYDSTLNDVIIQTRTHGYTNVENLKKAFSGKTIIVWKAEEVYTSFDENWNVDHYEIQPRFEPGTNIISSTYPGKRDTKSILHVEIGMRKRNQQGIGVLKPIWAQLVRANQILESMAAYDVRVGHGWLIITADTNQYKGMEQELANQVKTMNQRRFLILAQSQRTLPPKVDFIGANSKVDFPRDLETVMGFISSSSGFPVRFFIGSPKGAISAAKEDTIAVFQNLKSIFGQYKKFIRDFIKEFMEDGETIAEMIHEIEWDHEGILEEVEKQMSEEETEVEQNGENEQVPG